MTKLRPCLLTLQMRPPCQNMDEEPLEIPGESTELSIQTLGPQGPPQWERQSGNHEAVGEYGASGIGGQTHRGEASDG